MSATSERPSQTLNEAGRFTNGILSSTAMMTVVQPLSTVTTYLMSKKGMPPINALYRGFGSACAGTVPAQSMAMFTQGFFSGGVAAGFSSGITATPIERVVVLQQLRGLSAKNATLLFLEKEGLKGGFKGVVPTIVREVIFNDALFRGKQKVEAALQGKIENARARSMTASFIAGSFAGFCSTPAHWIKTRMQGDLEGSHSMFEVAKKIVQTEQAGDLIKGAAARTMMVGVALVVIGEAMEAIPPYLPSWMQKKPQKQ